MDLTPYLHGAKQLRQMLRDINYPGRSKLTKRQDMYQALVNVGHYRGDTTKHEDILSRLPFELFELVASQLDLFDLVKLAKTSRRMNYWCSSDRLARETLKVTMSGVPGANRIIDSGLWSPEDLWWIYKSTHQSVPLCQGLSTSSMGHHEKSDLLISVIDDCYLEDTVEGWLAQRYRADIVHFRDWVPPR